MRNAILVCLAAFVLPLSAIAQPVRHTLRGQVLDGNGYPVEFATVSLTDTLQRAGAITAADGAFSLQVAAGRHTLQVRCIGFEEQEVTVDVNADTELPKIILKTSNTELDAAIVQAKRPVVTRAVDRVILDARSLSRASTNALDLLKHAPGVLVDMQGNVSAVGKGKVIVLVNGREQHMEGAELANYLRNLRSADVATIEVMTTPPAKYAAEGDAGIINIVERKRLTDYFGGTVSDNHYSSLGQTNDAALSLKYKRGALSLYANATLGLGTRITDYTTLRTFADQAWRTETRQRNNNYYLNAKVGGDYSISPSLEVGAYYSFFDFTPHEDITQNTGITIGGAPYGEYTAHNDARYTVRRHNANLHLSKEFEGGQELELEADYVWNRIRHSADYQARGIRPYRFSNGLDRGAGILSTRLDFTLPISKRMRLELGASYVNAQTDNKTDYRDRPGLPNQHDHFRYTEGVAGAYADLMLRLHPKFTAKLGLRDEVTHTLGQQKSGSGQDFKHLRNNLFPTLFARYTPAENHVLSLSASTRIRRPSFFAVNPFLFYQSQYQYWVGNPELQPAYAVNGQLSYTFRNNLNVGFSYRITTNGMEQIATTDHATGITRAEWLNGTTTQLYILQGRYTWAPAFWFEGMLYPSLYYLTSSTKLLGLPRWAAKWNYLVYGSATFYFNRAQTISLEVNAQEASAERYVNETTFRRFYLGAGAKWVTLKGKLILGVKAYNIIATNTGSREETPGSQVIENTYPQPLLLNFSVSYSFGGAIKTREYRSMNRETVGRI